MSKPAQATPSRCNRWVVLAYLIIMQAVTVGISLYGFAFFLAPWANDFGVAPSVIMLGITGYILFSGVINPGCGYALDHYPSKTLLLLGALTFTAGLVAIGLAPNYIVVIGLFSLILPFGACLAGPLIAYGIVASLFAESRGRALGLVALGTNVGGVIVPLVVTRLLEHFDWRMVFFILAAIVIILVILPALILIERQDAEAKRAQAKSSGGMRMMLSLPVVQLALTYLAPSLLFMAVLHNIAALAADITIPAKDAAWITAAASIFMATGKVGVGALSDRYDHRMIYVTLVATMVCGIALTSLATTFLTLIAGVCLVALVQGGATPFVGAIAAARWGMENFGRVMGVVYAVTCFSAFGPIIAGFIRDSRGSYSEAFIWLLLALIPALYCFFKLPASVRSNATDPAAA